MRIGVNCFLLQPDIGGIRQYFFNLFNALLDSDNCNEYVFFYFEHNSDELNKLRSDRWRKHSILLELPKDIYSHLSKVDLYFCPFSTLSPRPVSMPTVYTIPDIQETFYPQFFSNYLIVARRYHYYGSSKMADRVITHSEFSKDSLVRHHCISPEKVIVAHHCVDDRFNRSHEIMRPPKQSLPDEYIFYPANQWVHKNHDLLLNALAWLKNEKQIKVNLVVTGFAKEDGYSLKNNAASLGLSDQVYQLGYVSVEELVYIYVHARMLVFPSLFEGFGIPLVEAMATGCPVLAAKATSLPEIGGDAAQYFDPSSYEDCGDAIFKLWNDEDTRERLSEKGKVRVKQFSADQLAGKHIIAFNQAFETFSMQRYWWNRLINKYLYAAGMLLRPEFYGMLYDIYLRKWRKLMLLIKITNNKENG